MMKKNILVILIVIGVIGAVLYLLKDRLKVLLAERAEREEIEEPIPDSAYRWYRHGPLTGVSPALMEGIRQRKEPTAIYDYAATWIGADIVGVIREIYPPFPEHGSVLESLVTYKKGQVVAAQFPRTNGLGYRGPGVGPLIELPQF